MIYPSTQEAEVGGKMANLRPAWATYTARPVSKHKQVSKQKIVIISRDSIHKILSIMPWHRINAFFYASFYY
jgi:hypothetical protein